MAYLVGIDGGGTRTTAVLAAVDGPELYRHSGAAGLVRPHAPRASAEVVAEVVREAVALAGLEGSAAALCAGLAGVEHEVDRNAVLAALQASGLAERVAVVSDGHIAVEGALGARVGLLLLAGTGSIAYARRADGTVHRCGGWGMVLGDEGSAYGTGRAALRAALHAFDGRGPASSLLDALLAETSSATPRGLPAWAGRVAKAEVAALTRVVEAEARAGDVVARRLLDEAAKALAAHLPPLVTWLDASRARQRDRLLPLVFFGGMFRLDGFEARVREAVLAVLPDAVAFREAEADAVTGAIHIAQALARRPLTDAV